jgi:hypothetical protein
MTFVLNVFWDAILLIKYFKKYGYVKHHPNFTFTFMIVLRSETVV